MRHAVRFVSHGVAIGLTSDDPSTLEAAVPFLPPLRSAGQDGRADRLFRFSIAHEEGKAVHSLHAGHRLLASSPHLIRVMSVLEWEVNLLVAQRARDRIFVHAGAVEWQGRAILIPGRSFSGKSTLVAELVHAGCGYLSDEYAILDSAGRCHAYPRALSLRRAGSAEKVSAEALGGRTQHEPLAVGTVVVTRFRRGATWKPRPITAGETVMALLENTVVARARAREALAALSAATADAAGFDGVRGDAAQVARELLAMRAIAAVH